MRPSGRGPAQAACRRLQLAWSRRVLRSWPPRTLRPLSESPVAVSRTWKPPVKRYELGTIHRHVATPTCAGEPNTNNARVPVGSTRTVGDAVQSGRKSEHARRPVTVESLF